MNTQLFAHRGDTKHFPENTLEAFESAFAHGAAGVELDIHERGGELIVVHHYRYDPTQTYPTLPEVLKRFSGQGRLEIEIKPLELGFIEPLKSALEPYHDANIELTTSVAGLMHHIRREFPHFPLGAILQDREFEDWMIAEDFVNTKVAKLAALYDAAIVHLPARVLTEGLVQELHDDSRLVHSHIPRGAMPEQLKTYQTFCDMGVDQATCDDIDLIANLQP